MGSRRSDLSHSSSRALFRHLHCYVGFSSGTYFQHNQNKCSNPVLHSLPFSTSKELDEWCAQSILFQIFHNNPVFDITADLLTLFFYVCVFLHDYVANLQQTQMVTFSFLFNSFIQKFSDLKFVVMKSNWVRFAAPMFYKGFYHLFYQYNPQEVVWGNIFWGHVVSKDLINWHSLDPAIVPSEWYDIKGFWFGSATLLLGDKPVIFYTRFIPIGAKRGHS